MTSEADSVHGRKRFEIYVWISDNAKTAHDMENAEVLPELLLRHLFWP